LLPPKSPLQKKKAPESGARVPIKSRPLRRRLHVPSAYLEDQVLSERLPEQRVHDGLVLVVLLVHAFPGEERDLKVVLDDRRSSGFHHLARHVVSLGTRPADEREDIRQGVSRGEGVLRLLVEVDRQPSLPRRGLRRFYNLGHGDLLLVVMLPLPRSRVILAFPLQGLHPPLPRF